MDTNDKNGAEQEVNPMSLLDAIRKAWKEYNEINGDYSYHLEEGGGSDFTREDVSNAWSKLNALMSSNENNEGRIAPKETTDEQ